MNRWQTGFVVMLVGCGGGGGEQVDCSYFEGANCWRTAANEAAACLGDAEDGVFDAGRLVCTYTEGTVEFETAAPEDIFSATWDFDVVVGGDTCASYEEVSEDAFSLTTASGTVSYALEGTDVLITCPDEVQYQVDGFEIFNCLNDAPGTATSGSGGLIQFNLLGGDGDGTDRVFLCDDP